MDTANREANALSGAKEIAQQIRCAVRQATNARVQKLAVQVNGKSIVLEGSCSTFHCYQLAQHAAMQLADDRMVDNRIEVS